MPSYKTDKAKWEAVKSRDASADGAFVYSVKTTGIYCRPSCGSRLPRRENVAFHLDCAAAEQAGFRACKRCRPNEASLRELHAKEIEKACRLIEHTEEVPSLDVLAETAGMSRFHFHRVFKAVTGLTPKAYANAYRGAKARIALAGGERVTNALYDAGFNSSARFYANAPQILGMRPASYRSGGQDETIRFALGQCSLGDILVAASEKGICAITLGDDANLLLRDLQDRFPKARLVGAEKDFETWVAQIVGFVEAPQLGLELPLDIRGTAFQQRVWQALRNIPAGSTASYSEIAAKIGAPRSVRAVAGACAANALAVAIPCHRVVALDGSLSGYRWGIARKTVLLKRER
jgi:AraC family transcriptional regulator of adaptative response/methylated-DNA-[protein]-cysteine methyltransferase